MAIQSWGRSRKPRGRWHLEDPAKRRGLIRGAVCGRHGYDLLVADPKLFREMSDSQCAQCARKVNQET